MPESCNRVNLHNLLLRLRAVYALFIRRGLTRPPDLPWVSGALSRGQPPSQERSAEMETYEETKEFLGQKLSSHAKSKLEGLGHLFLSWSMT